MGSGRKNSGRLEGHKLHGGPSGLWSWTWTALQGLLGTTRCMSWTWLACPVPHSLGRDQGSRPPGPVMRTPEPFWALDWSPRGVCPGWPGCHSLCEALFMWCSQECLLQTQV